MCWSLHQWALSCFSVRNKELGQPSLAAPRTKAHGSPPRRRGRSSRDRSPPRLEAPRAYSQHNAAWHRYASAIPSFPPSPMDQGWGTVTPPSGNWNPHMAPQSYVPQTGYQPAMAPQTSAGEPTPYPPPPHPLQRRGDTEYSPWRGRGMRRVRLGLRQPGGGTLCRAPLSATFSRQGPPERAIFGLPRHDHHGPQNRDGTEGHSGPVSLVTRSLTEETLLQDGHHRVPVRGRRSPVSSQ